MSIFCAVFIIVICTIKLSNECRIDTLHNELISTEIFFQNLANTYEKMTLGQEELKEIDDKIAKFTQTLQSPIDHRHKRHLDEHTQQTDGGIRILKGFSEVLADSFPNALAISIFTYDNGIKLQWLAAALDDSKVSLSLYNGNQFKVINTYPVTGGLRLIADCSQHGCLLVVGNTDGSVMILRLQFEVNKYVLRPVQYLKGFVGDVHLSIWHGMNQMFLGIASSGGSSIYLWLGENFDLIQVLNYGTGKLIPFRIGGSLYLAVTGHQTTVLKFDLQTHEFIFAQRLPLAYDVDSFYVEEGYQREYYLGLSNKESTIIYKFVRDHFIPFQKIERADQISSIQIKKTIVSFAVKTNLLKIYQYNGWKFVELVVTMQEVDRIYPTLLDDEIILIVKHKNGAWKFYKLNWIQLNTLDILEAEIKTWCIDTLKKAKTQPTMAFELVGPVTFSHGYVGKLQTTLVNNENADDLIKLASRFERLRMDLSKSKGLLSEFIKKENPKFITLHTTRFLGNCTRGCKINNLSTSVKSGLLDKLAKPSVIDHKLVFETVKAQTIGTLPCPKPAFTLKDVTVSDRINEIKLESFQEEVLRITGDQEITAEHFYENLFTSSALIPLDIATGSTQQELHAHSMKVDNLYLTQGGILLPLNGEPVIINDTKTAAKVKVTGTVHTRGRVDGNGIRHLAPITWIDKTLKVRGDFSLQKTTVQNQTSTLDLIVGKEKSLIGIMNEAVNLEDDVPVHLKISRVKTTWTNITADMTKNWITVPISTSSFKSVKNITGTKHSPNNLILTQSSYEALPIPNFGSPLCASEANIADIETLFVLIDRASAAKLTTKYIRGAPKLNATITDTATSTSKLNLSSKVFKGAVNIEKGFLSDIDNVNFQRLLAAMIAWRQPGIVGGLVNASNLAIKRLVVPNGFVPPMITKARNLISTGNIYFDSLNRVNFSNLLQKIVKLDETISLTNVTFLTRLKANKIQTLLSPIDLSGSNNLGEKIIAGNLKLTNLKLPYSFTYPSTKTITTLSIQGSASFAVEPKVQNINQININRVFDAIWFTDLPSVLTNRIFVIRHVVVEGPVKILGWLNSQNYGPWNQTSEFLLSRTKPQVLNTHVYLRVTTAPNIITTNVLKLWAPETFLNGLSENTLKKDSPQNFTSNMRFQKIIISDDLNTHGTINGYDLSTDIVRSDVKKNIITGKKIVSSLHAENVESGSNFNEWQSHAMSSLNIEKPIIVTGFKKFANLTFLKPLSVGGLVNDRKMQDYFLKSLPQSITGIKTIHGTVNVSKIIVMGGINDVNLTAVVKHQLKKNEEMQTISTSISTTGQIKILGNLEVKDLYNGVGLKDLDEINSDLDLVSGRMAELELVAEKIQTALSRRAWYWNKLELIAVNSTSIIPKPVRYNTIEFQGLGKCEINNKDLTCDGELVKLLIFISNSSKLLFSQVFELAGDQLIVVATSDPNGGVWIYNYEHTSQKLHKVAGINLPGSTQASAIVAEDSLWLVVQLTWDTIIIRYESSDQFEKYTLPGSEVFLLEVSPTGELLIFRSDGVWRLGGLSGPRQLVKAQLDGVMSSYTAENDQYLQLSINNYTRLLKTRYIGD